MKMIYENVYSLKNFYKFNKKEKSEFVKIILDDKNKFFTKMGYNEAILTNVDLRDSKYTKILYNKFLELSQKKFGPFNLLKNNSTICYSLLTNEDNYASVPHNHINTSIINSVYYLSVPNQKGEIQFFIDNEWLNYQPEENELLIFPNYLEHNTTKNNTKEWRISINMEIMCDFNWKQKIEK